MPLRAWALSLFQRKNKMDYYYSFCGVRFRVSPEEALWEDTQSEQFHILPCAPDVTIEVASAPELPPPAGAFLGRRGEKRIWREGECITRQTQDIFRSCPHLSVSYALSQPHKVRALARADCWRWATRSSFFWPGVSLPQLLLPFHTLVFHASYVAHDGGALLFTAPSGTGKSTQAELWRVHRGARVLNGDKAAVRLSGAPTANGMPFSGTSGICENVSLPLRGVVVLSQAKENTVRRLGPSAAVAALGKNVFADRSIAEEWSAALNLLLDLAASVPVYALACTPDERAVCALEEAMARERREG